MDLNLEFMCSGVSSAKDQRIQKWLSTKFKHYDASTDCSL